MITSYNPNSSAPKLRVTTKVHKKDFPIRPIVNYKPAPAYKVKKQLVKILQNKLIQTNQYNIKNSIQLTNQLKKLPISSQSKLISLDIKDMFTNIPIAETLNIIKQQLQLDYDSKIIQQLIQLLSTSLKQNYFYYNGNYYEQKDGLPMGSPLSPILSEIFLQHLEAAHIDNIKKQYNIIYYGRYVDDIIVIYDNPTDTGNEILSKFNGIHNNIKFTIEKEEQNSINYLDIKIQKEKWYKNYRLKFNIYRKPTTSKLSINYNSHHPIDHKLANFRCLLNRLNRIPFSKNNYKKEMANIINIAHYNNFPISHIYKLNNKIKAKNLKKQYTTLSSNNLQNNKYVALEYCGNISEKVKKIFKKK